VYFTLYIFYIIF